MYRQGDVLIMTVEETTAPPGLVTAPRDRSGRMILARGEATGHAHVASGDGATLYCLPDDLETLFLRVTGYGRVTHEEHGPIAIPAGFYRVVRQREYLPGAIRPVAD